MRLASTDTILGIMGRKKQKQHGGERTGAGRPPKYDERQTQVTWTLPPDLLDWIDEQAEEMEVSRSEFITGVMERTRARRR